MAAWAFMGALLESFNKVELQSYRLERASPCLTFYDRRERQFLRRLKCKRRLLSKTALLAVQCTRWTERMRLSFSVVLAAIHHSGVSHSRICKSSWQCATGADVYAGLIVRSPVCEFKSAAAGLFASSARGKDGSLGAVAREGFIDMSLNRFTSTAAHHMLV